MLGLKPSRIKKSLPIENSIPLEFKVTLFSIRSNFSEILLIKLHNYSI